MRKNFKRIFFLSSFLLLTACNSSIEQNFIENIEYTEYYGDPNIVDKSDVFFDKHVEELFLTLNIKDEIEIVFIDVSEDIIIDLSYEFTKIKNDIEFIQILPDNSEKKISVFSSNSKKSTEDLTLNLSKGMNIFKLYTKHPTSCKFKMTFLIDDSNFDKIINYYYVDPSKI